jgi:ribonuclease P protein component
MGADAPQPGPAGPVSTLTRRAEFIAAARALRQGKPGFSLQARPRTDGEPATGIRVGFTCSRKVGNAVARNRAKRRLRAIARDVLPAEGRPGWDYVLVGGVRETAARNFATMCEDLRAALAAVHRKAPPP